MDPASLGPQGISGPTPGRTQHPIRFCTMPDSKLIYVLHPAGSKAIAGPNTQLGSTPCSTKHLIGSFIYVFNNIYNSKLLHKKSKDNKTLIKS